MKSTPLAQKHGNIYQNLPWPVDFPARFQEGIQGPRIVCKFCISNDLNLTGFHPLCLSLTLHEPGSKLVVLGMAIPPLIGNPYNGYINPYYWVDDHPLLYGNNGSWSTLAHQHLSYELFQILRTQGSSSRSPKCKLLFSLRHFGSWNNLFTRYHLPCWIYIYNPSEELKTCPWLSELFLFNLAIVYRQGDHLGHKFRITSIKSSHCT